MKNEKHKNLFKIESGITLVALIITIIVLLILAMVSIRLVMNGGIITRADNAVSDYKSSEEIEQIQLGYSEYQMASLYGTPENLNVKGATVTSNSNGWTVQFNGTQHQYSLSADGRTINLLSENSQSNLQTFTFTISDEYNTNPITYTAEEGMTWQQWVNSTYNTDGIIIEDDYVLNSSGTRAIFRKLQGKQNSYPAKSNQIIMPNFVECFWGVDWSITPGNEDKENSKTGKN